MQRCIGFIALASMFVMLGGAATPAAIEKAFGNTIVSTYPDNRKAELWLEPSGAYTAMGRRGDRSSGHWRIKGDKLCLKQDHPASVPFFSYCTPIPTEEEWTAKAVTGETIQVRVVKGRQVAPPS